MEKMQNLLSWIQEAGRTVGLNINKTKTEYMLIVDFVDTILPTPRLKVPLKKAEDFKYLGSWINWPDHDLDVYKAHV